MERNIARQRKYDERVKAELEAAGIDPMREQEEKTARIAAKAERAEERRRSGLTNELHDEQFLQFRKVRQGPSYLQKIGFGAAENEPLKTSR